MTGATGARGFVLWLLLLLAVFVREIARALGAAWFGLELRSVLLLPIGGLLSYATPEATELAATPEMQKRMAVIGPMANIGFGLLLGAIALTFSPEVNLYERPWLSPSHLLRAAVWMNLVAGCGEPSAGLAARWRARLSRRVCEGERRNQGFSGSDRTGSGDRHRADDRRVPDAKYLADHDRWICPDRRTYGRPGPVAADRC